MATHKLSKKSWTNEIRKVIATGEDDDTVIVPDAELKNLVQATLDRMCSDKTFVVVVE